MLTDASRFDHQIGKLELQRRLIGLGMQKSPNLNAIMLIEAAMNAPGSRVQELEVEGTRVFDFGIESSGSLVAGRWLAEICMGGLGHVAIQACDQRRFVVGNQVVVHTDAPKMACLGCQYAGWPVQTDDYFAMGSGPARLHRGREPLLGKYELKDADSNLAVVVLESDKFPSKSTLEVIKEHCQLEADAIRICIAPSTSLAGTIQVVARSIETAMHKLDELEFDVSQVISGTGAAPLPPPAKPGDMVGGIGRTNDAMLYGAEVTLFVACEDDAIEGVIEKVPSSSSADYGRPFAKIFADYKYDFYEVDPALFSPAAVSIHNLKSGRTFAAGEIQTQVLRESFLS